MGTGNHAFMCSVRMVMKIIPRTCSLSVNTQKTIALLCFKNNGEKQLTVTAYHIIHNVNGLFQKKKKTGFFGFFTLPLEIPDKTRLHP